MNALKALVEKHRGRIVAYDVGRKKIEFEALSAKELDAIMKDIVENPGVVPDAWTVSGNFEVPTAPRPVGQISETTEAFVRRLHGADDESGKGFV